MANSAAAAFVFWLWVVAVFDLRRRRIPNWLVLAGLVAGSIAIATGTQPFGLNWSAAFAGGAAAFAFMLVFYIAKLMGAGDVKFAGALGFWIALDPLFEVWAIGSALAAAHGVAWWALHRWPIWPRLALALSGPASPDQPARRPRPIPYGAYLALGALGWMVWLR
ncbi:MAG: prepilin peptidase [Comamonadaceae bacterium]|nr:MAG: prepilin peptidase [Comamonadaceae bacterium]